MQKIERRSTVKKLQNSPKNDDDFFLKTIKSKGFCHVNMNLISFIG